MVVRVNGRKINKMRAAERHPEKAGVGGSSPSLATTLSIAYRREVSHGSIDSGYQRGIRLW